MLTICFVCYLRVFFVCLFVRLFVLIYNVSQKVLKVHFRRRFSKVVFRTGSTMELVVCRSLLQRPKTDSFFKYKIRFPWIPYIAEERVSSFLNYTYTAHRITRWQRSITCSCRCEFPQGRKFQYEPKTTAYNLRRHTP